MRYAGYDHIVITGASDTPVYLWIDGSRVEIRDAAHLWGMGTRETESTIRAELGDVQIETAVVGPAAENGVKFAAIIMSRFDTAGRGGIGTVMGDKRLKAVTVRGSGGIPAADVDSFKALSKIISTEIVTDETSARKRRYGIVSSMGDLGRGYSVGAYNSRGTIGDDATRLSGRSIAERG